MLIRFNENQRRRIGNTDLMVSPLSLGTVKLGRNSGVGYPQSFHLPTDDSVTELLQLASDLGINLLDTAPAYGSSEARLGQLLPGPRENWILCTKAGESYDGNTSSFDYSRAAIEKSVRQSLKNLATDYLDIVLIHSDGDDQKILDQTDAMKTLHELKSKGVIRYVGISTKTTGGALLAMDQSDVLMLTLNLADQSQLPMIKKASGLGVGVLLKKVLNRGHTDNPLESLKLALGTEGVASAVVGTLSGAHLEENVRSAVSIIA